MTLRRQEFVVMGDDSTDEFPEAVRESRSESLLPRLDDERPDGSRGLNSRPFRAACTEGSVPAGTPADVC